MKEPILEFFSQFGHITNAEKTFIEKAFSRAEFKAKQMMLFEGDVCQSIYFIISGLSRIGIIDRDGNDISINFRAEGEFMTDYESFLRSSPSDYFIEALEDTITYKMDRQSLNELYEKMSIGNLIGRRISEELFIETYTHLTSFYKYSAEERYETFISDQGALLNRIPQSHLASYLGIKPQSLSRIKRRYLQNS